MNSTVSTPGAARPAFSPRLPASQEPRPIALLLIVVVYLCAYFTAARPFLNENLATLLLVPLFVFTIGNLGRFNREACIIGGALAALTLYYALLSRDLNVARKEFVYVCALIYICALRALHSEKGLSMVLACLALFFGLSNLVMIGSVFHPGFLDLRDRLYPLDNAGLVSLLDEGLDPEMQELVQGGLKRFPHEFGYQLAAGGTLSLALAIMSRGKRRFVFSGLSVLAIFTLLLAGQRSAVLSVGVATACVALIARRIGLVLLLMALLTTASVALAPKLFDLVDFRRYNTISRMENPEDDLGNRARLQLWAAKEIRRYPFGTIGAGVDYKSIAPTYARTEFRILAPHNGYLTRALLYGWPVILVLAVVAHRVGRLGLATIRRARIGRARPVEIATFAAVVAVTINGLFHNASILTFQEESVVLCFLYVVVAEACGATPGQRSVRHFIVTPKRTREVKPAEIAPPISPTASASTP